MSKNFILQKEVERPAKELKTDESQGLMDDMSREDDVTKTLQAILNNTNQIAERLENIENRLGGVERRVEAVENRFRLPETPSSVKMMQEISIRSLSQAESRVYFKIQELEERHGYATLHNLREELPLNYRTIAGYTNRFVKYGILKIEWDPEEKINHYLTIR